MSKIKMKTSGRFHSSVESSLDLIMKEGDTIMKKNTFKRAASVAATLIIIAAAAVFGAEATGVIDLNGTFKKIFGIENDNKKQEIARQISSQALPEAYANGVTVKVVQSVNDTNHAVILLELTAEDNILHPEMLPLDMNIEIEGARISSSSGSPHFQSAKTIEQLKAESEQTQAAIEEYTEPDTEQLQAEFDSKYTDKIHLLISLHSDVPILGKDIELKLKGLVAVTDNLSKEQALLDTNIALSWQLSDSLKSRTVKLNKEVHGIKLDSITLTPIGYTLTLAEPVDFDESIDVPEGQLDNSVKINFHGVRFNDGTTRVLQKGDGYLTPTEVSGSFFDIVDIDEVQSIFIGDFQEIPLG